MKIIIWVLCYSAAVWFPFILWRALEAIEDKWWRLPTLLMGFPVEVIFIWATLRGIIAFGKWAEK